MGGTDSLERARHFGHHAILGALVFLTGWYTRRVHNYHHQGDESE